MRFCGLREVTFELGAFYNREGFRGKTAKYQFIKVTPKGFNFLNVERGVCVHKCHLYCKDWVGKPMPRLKPGDKVVLSVPFQFAIMYDKFEKIA